MTRRYRFFQLDVFTTQRFSGNPLAVFPDADGLSDAEMQAIAREMNLSETTFVRSSARATRQLRIFTPAAEVPLAGHPVIGTWWLLAERRLVELDGDGVVEVTQETGRGVLPVFIEMRAGRPIRVEMVQARPQFLGIVNHRAELERLLGGAGAELARFLEAHGTHCVMCYTLETRSPDATVHARMFAPGLAVPEDPATGSAAGALGAYLVRHGALPPGSDPTRIVVEQGIEIGRPSRIEVTVTAPDGTVREVRVGGQAVTVLQGEVEL